MKRALIALGLALLLAGGALAEEAAQPVARNIVGQCRLRGSTGSAALSLLTDGIIGAIWAPTNPHKQAYLQIDAPAGQAMHGLYLQWGYAPGRWEARVRQADGSWQTVYTGGEQDFLEEYVPLPGVATGVRLYAGETGLDYRLNIMELAVLGEGELPDWVHVWKAAPDQVDLMVVSAHCDDELVFFGAVLPIYAGGEGRETVTVYIAPGLDRRKVEALDGLWACGVRNYPVFGTFSDLRTKKLNDMRRIWGGADSLPDFLAAQIRKYRPQVIVSHDPQGEYGHGAHRWTSQAVLEAVQRSADGQYRSPDPLATSPWQASKVYLHLYPERQLELNMRQPLAAMGGRTALEIAEEAFAYHRSQQAIRYRPTDQGVYSCSRYGLAFSNVGDDAQGGDLFENIPPPLPETDRLMQAQSAEGGIR